jgi:hypothetical protein
MPAPRYAAFGLVAMAFLGIAWVLLQPRPAAPPIHPPAPIPEPAAPASAQPVTAQPELILELFEPTPESLDAQHRNRKLRGRIEEALVATFVLTRCGYFNTAEYNATYNAFIRYAVQVGLAPDSASAATEIRQLAESAGASYSLVYSRLPCADASLAPMAQSLRQWQVQPPTSS